MSTSFDWATSIKPLLAASFNNFSFHPDLFKLARSIESSSTEILNHDAEFEPFYSSFVALSTHFLCFNSSNVPKNQIPSVLSACNVLTDFILSRLEKHYDQTSLTPKQLVLLIKGLCKGFGCLQRSDTITLTAVMKSSQFPPRIRSTIGPERSEEDIEASPKTGRGRSPPAGRVDPLSDVLDCLSSPLSLEMVAVRGSKEKSPKDKKDPASSSNVGDYEKIVSCKELFVQENVHYLMRKNAGSILIDVCLKLPFLNRYNLMTRDLFQGNLTFPSSQAECQAVQDSYLSLRTDIAVVSVVVTFPLMEPLNLDRLNKLCNLGCSCLLSGCTVISSHRTLVGNIKDLASAQEFETLVNRIAEKALFVFSTIVNVVQNSHNTGGTQLQNCRILGAWCLLAGISHMLKTFDIDSALVALGQQLLTLLKPILVDLKMDPGKVEPLNELNVNTVSTSWQKVKYLNRHVKIVHVLLELAAESFSKAVVLRKKPRAIADTPIKEMPEQQTPILDIDHPAAELILAPATPAPPTGETDGEPLLGNWLEELLASVPQLVDSAGALQTERRRFTGSDLSACFGHKDDPNLFMTFAISCLSVSNDHIFTGCRNDLLVENFGFSWTDRELTQLSNMIRLLEQQNMTNFSDGILLDFNAALIRFIHNLFANGLMSENQEIAFLSKLNIYIDIDVKDEWLLRISPRILGILGQIVLLRHFREREDYSKGDSDSVVVNIWQRFTNTLKINTFVSHDIAEFNDVNVDHLQLLLLFFHSLSLMAKKTVLLHISTTISSVIGENRSKRFLTKQPSSHFARLLLIFDYLIRYFYEPPPSLLDQVKSNIFPLQSRSNEGYDKNHKSLLMLSPDPPRIYYPCPEFEEAYQSNTRTSQQTKMKPLFYNLIPDTSCCDLPKLDGLALSFLLNSNQYDECYANFLDLLTFDYEFLNVESRDDPTLSFKRSVACYTCNIVWRLLGALPPSVDVLKRLKNIQEKNIDAQLMIFVLRVGPRLLEPSFSNWVKDGLHRQKMSPDEADALLQDVGFYLNSAKFLTTLSTIALQNKVASWNDLDSKRDISHRHLYPMGDMITTDLLLNRLYFVFLKSNEKDSVIDLNLNDLINVLEQLIAKYYNLAKYILIENACRLTMDPFPDNQQSRLAVSKLMSVCTPSISCDRAYDFGLSAWMHTHQSIRCVIAEWNREDLASRGYPGLSNVDKYSDQMILTETFVSTIYLTHLHNISGKVDVASRAVVQQLLSSCVYTLIYMIKKFRPATFDLATCTDTFTPLLLDVTTHYLSEEVYALMTDSNFYTPKDEERFLLAINRFVCSVCFDIIVLRSKSKDLAIMPTIFDTIVNYMEELLQKSYGYQAVVDFLNKSCDVSVLLRTALSTTEEGNTVNAHSFKLIRLFNAIFKTAESHQNLNTLNSLCDKIVHSLVLDIKVHEKWFKSQFSSERFDEASSTSMSHLTL